MIGSSLVYGRTMNPSFTSCFDALSNPSVSGKRVFSSPITSSFTMFDIPASRARKQVRTASSTL